MSPEALNEATVQLTVATFSLYLACAFGWLGIRILGDRYDRVVDQWRDVPRRSHAEDAQP